MVRDGQLWLGMVSYGRDGQLWLGSSVSVFSHCWTASCC